jgi:hypothetical protein
MNRLSLAHRLKVSTQRATPCGDAADEIPSLAGATGEFCEN